MTRDRHTQTGWILRIFVIAPALVLLLVGPALRDHAAMSILLPLVAFLAVLGFLFSTLTIEIDDKDLRWRFGLGVWRKSVALADIVLASRVRNPWWYGFGIHLTPYGWLYNVGGLDAVQIVLRDGRRVRLGTDEPDALARSLASCIHAW